ncbi:MAG: hypothetical protein HOA17_06750 [Candidatus Melainabacteria bacterium]|jgi:hypothetical protein|nr:hypothetical protein [Candidatus Melainabacteria bacterium]
MTNIKEKVMQDKFTIEPMGTYNRGLCKDEILKQVESLRNFYYQMGYDTVNVKTIFSLTISYLKGSVNKMIVRAFFDVLMQGNRLNTGKEVNLLNCFDELIDNFSYQEEKSREIDMQLDFGLQA